MSRKQIRSVMKRMCRSRIPMASLLRQRFMNDMVDYLSRVQEGNPVINPSKYLNSPFSLDIGQATMELIDHHVRNKYFQDEMDEIVTMCGREEVSTCFQRSYISSKLFQYGSWLQCHDDHSNLRFFAISGELYLRFATAQLDSLQPQIKQSTIDAMDISRFPKDGYRKLDAYSKLLLLEASTRSLEL